MQVLNPSVRVHHLYKGRVPALAALAHYSERQTTAKDSIPAHRHTPQSLYLALAIAYPNVSQIVKQYYAR